MCAEADLAFLQALEISSHLYTGMAQQESVHRNGKTSNSAWLIEACLKSGRKKSGFAEERNIGLSDALDRLVRIYGRPRSCIRVLLCEFE